MKLKVKEMVGGVELLADKKKKKKGRQISSSCSEMIPHLEQEWSSSCEEQNPERYPVKDLQEPSAGLLKMMMVDQRPFSTSCCILLQNPDGGQRTGSTCYMLLSTSGVRI